MEEHDGDFDNAGISGVSGNRERERWRSVSGACNFRVRVGVAVAFRGLKKFELNPAAMERFTAKHIVTDLHTAAWTLYSKRGEIFEKLSKADVADIFCFNAWISTWDSIRVGSEFLSEGCLRWSDEEDEEYDPVVIRRPQFRK